MIHAEMIEQFGKPNSQFYKNRWYKIFPNWWFTLGFTTSHHIHKKTPRKQFLGKHSWRYLGIINSDAPFSEFPLWQVVVQAGCRGTVLAEFSDTRLTVVFETSETGTPSCFNVLPLLENTAGFVVGI
jgi:hypothetical protein